MDQVHQAPSITYWHSEAYDPDELTTLIHSANPKLYTAKYPLLILNWDQAFKDSYSKRLPNFTKAHVIRFTKEGIITKFHSNEPEFSTWRAKLDEDKAAEPFLLLDKEPSLQLSVVAPIPLTSSQITNLQKAKAFVPADKQTFLDDMIAGKTALDNVLEEKFPIVPYEVPQLSVSEKKLASVSTSLSGTSCEPVVVEKEWIVEKIERHKVTANGYEFLTQYNEGNACWVPAGDFYDVLPDHSIQYEEQFKKYCDTHNITMLKLLAAEEQTDVEVEKFVNKKASTNKRKLQTAANENSEEKSHPKRRKVAKK